MALLTSPGVAAESDRGPVSDYAGAWEYRWGDSPRTPLGTLVWAQPQHLDAGWRATTVLASPAERNGAHYLWLRTRLVGPPLTHPELFIIAIDQSYEAYLDGQPIGHFGPMVNQSRRFPGVPLVFLPLGPDYIGKTLTLRIFSPYRWIGVFRQPRLGETGAVRREVIGEGFPVIVTGFLLGLVGLAALVLFVLRRNERAYLYYAGLALGLGTYVAARSVAREFVFDLGPGWTYLELASCPLGLASLCGFVAEAFGAGPRNIVRRLGQAILIISAGGAFLIANRIIHVWSTLPPLRILILVTLFVLIGPAVSAVQRREAESRAFGIGMLGTLAIALLEILTMFGVVPRWRQTVVHYGAATFLLAMGIPLALRFVRLAEQGALLDAAARMAGGDLDSPIVVPAASKLWSLAGALDGMRRHLQATQQDLQAKVQVLQVRNQEIQQLNDELRRQIEQRSRRLMETLIPKDRPLTRLATLRPGDLLGDCYCVVRIIGEGGMGVVYEVERTTDQRRLAAKMLRNVPDRTALGRFAREAQIMARLSHPNLIAISDIDTTGDGALYLVMELVRGTSLWHLRARFGEVPWALHILRQVAEALAALHAQGVVHRDLKPDNTLIVQPDAVGLPLVKLADFGISLLLDGEPTGEPAVAIALPSELGKAPTTPGNPSAAGSDQQLTGTGVIMGTPLYIAPELLFGSKNAQRMSDVFSLGVMAFELLTGRVPFDCPPVELRALGREWKIPQTLRHVGITPALADILERCLALDPDERPSAEQVALSLKT